MANSLKRIVYRCTLCGEAVTGEADVSIPDEQMQTFCSMVVRNQRFVGNPYLHQAPMYLTHNCADGSCGVAYFAGIKKENYNHA